MPRQRSPNRDEARKIYIKKLGNIALTEIAKQLNETDSTVRGWKTKDNWDGILNGTLQTKRPKRSEKDKKRSENPKRSEKDKKRSKSLERLEHLEKVVPDNESNNESNKTNTPHPQARFGNKNAYGNKGGKGGPKGNKFALTTGEFESVFFTPDIIDEDERALLEAPFNKYISQLVIIKTEQARAKRIMKRIAELKDTPGGMVFDSVSKSKSTTTTQYRKRDGDGQLVDGSSNTVTEDGSSHVAVPIRAAIKDLEDALTRVQGRLQRAIEVWHKMEVEDEKRIIDRAKFRLYTQRLAGYVDLDELLDDEQLWQLLDDDNGVIEA